MPRASGSYTPPSSSWYPAVSGTAAAFADWNALLADLSTALTQSLSQDGQTSPTGNLPMAGFKHTGASNATATGQYLVWGQDFTAGAPTFSGAVQCNSTLTVTGATNLTNNLTVGGTSTLNGATTVTNATAAPFTATGTVAAGLVYHRFANTSGVSGGAVAMSLDPGAGGAGVRDFSIRATNNGSNQISTGFWTANGAPVFEAWRISPSGDLWAIPQTNTLNIGGTSNSFPLTITRTATVGELFRISGTAGTTCGLGVTASDTMNFYTGGVARFRYSQSDGLLITTQGCFGYGAGAGGTVTQLTSKATGVTLNTQSGLITLNAANLAAAAEVSFVVTNSQVTATDVVVVHRANGGTDSAYQVYCDGVAAGSFRVTISNRTGGALAQSFNVIFAIFRGATT